MSPRRHSVLAGAAIVPLVAACAGAGGSRVLDAKQTSQQISGYLAASFAVANPAVKCPGGVKVETGKTFDCHTAIEGQPLTVHVTLTDAQGRFTPTPGAALVIVAKIVSAIQTSEATATIRCGTHTVLVARPHDTFTCTAATATGPVTYRVTVQDLAGNVRYEPVPQAP